MKEKKIDRKILIDILSRPEKVVRYRNERWGEQINTLYLQNKEKYNLVTYNLLEANDIDVMYEVYFRIKDKEETWSDIAKKFPEVIKIRQQSSAQRQYHKLMKDC